LKSGQKMASSKAQPERGEVSRKHREAQPASLLAVLVREVVAFRLTEIAKHLLRSLIDNKHDELGGSVLNVQA
jgi:hypothetical protein